MSCRLWEVLKSLPALWPHPSCLTHPGAQEAAAGSMGSREQGPCGHRLLPWMFRGRLGPEGPMACWGPTVSVRTRTWSTGVPISLHPLAAQDGGRLRVTRRRWPDFFQLNLSDVGGEGPGSQSPPYPWQSAECVIVGVSVSRYEYMCVRAWAQRICVSVPELVKACVCMSACM